MKLMIIRHGDPDYEHDTLTEKGWREAKLLADKIKNIPMDYFYMSSCGRAMDTAKPTLEAVHKEAVICDWLREFDHDIWMEDGTKKHIAWDMFPDYWTEEAAYFNPKKWCDTPVMQSGKIKEYYDEVIAKLDQTLAAHGYARKANYYEAPKANTDTVVFFCHFGMECVLLSHLLNISPVQLWHGTVALPSAVTTLTTEERQEGVAYFRMSTFGDVSHLTAAGEEPSFSGRFCETYEDKTHRH